MTVQTRPTSAFFSADLAHSDPEVAKAIVFHPPPA